MIDIKTRQGLQKIMEEGVIFDIPMARHTSLRVGGPADAMALPRTREQLSALLQFCNEHHLDQFILGGGFNTLVLDGGVEAVVISLARFRELRREPGNQLYAEVGLPHHRVTKFCTEEGLGGLEFGVGIPGTVGGWLMMNAGIGTHEMKDVVASIEVMDPSGKEVHVLEGDQLQFKYRSLCGIPAESVLLAARFQLQEASPESIRAETHRLLEQRATTQPVNRPSCGSVFKNPPGTSAGQLIDDAGLKGFRIGGAQISDIHANFIVTEGKVRAADVLSLIEKAQEEVEKRTGIHLQPEVRIVGRTVR
jgi:UDP-N-acetylmuramate dehydrogenase